jgi:hypothetical protein
MICELNQPWPVISPRGRSLCLALIDYGSQTSLLFVCVQCGTGEIWIWQQKDVRMEPNVTFGIEFKEPTV